MARRKPDPKVEALPESRTLNPRPEAVTDEAFTSSEFFDARDLVQVKYEMLRRVSEDGVSVSSAAAAFGLSRQTYYQAAAALGEAGLAGLLPGKPGTAGGAQAHRRGRRAPAGAGGLRSWAAPGRAGRGGGAAVRDTGAFPLGRARARPGSGVRSEPEKRLNPHRAGTGSGWRATTSGCAPRCWLPGPMGGGAAGRCWPAAAWPPGSPRGPPWTRRLTGTARR